MSHHFQFTALPPSHFNNCWKLTAETALLNNFPIYQVVAVGSNCTWSSYPGPRRVPCPLHFYSSLSTLTTPSPSCVTTRAAPAVGAKQLPHPLPVASSREAQSVGASRPSRFKVCFVTDNTRSAAGFQNFLSALKFYLQLKITENAQQESLHTKHRLVVQRERRINTTNCIHS
jgi:hypothetical protein